MTIRQLATALLLALLACPLVAQEAPLVFSSPPRGSEQQDMERYTPLVRALSAWLGREVVYSYPKDFTTYSFAMRRGEYDIVLDGPHLTAWRMQRLQHRPVVKLPGEIRFLVAGPASDPALTDRDSLIGLRVCGLSSPHLGTLQFMAQYTNPVQQPVVYAQRGGFGAVYKAFREGQCRAALFREFYFEKKIPAEERQGLKIVFDVPALPEQTLTVGPRLGAAEMQTLHERLTDPAVAAPVAGRIFASFRPEATAFVAADPQEYAGLERLLMNNIWGWE
ncbi:MAG: PhnD/SsuA/transferrin family substrate-binding protein [Chromatiales bacterium]|nr:PhnD/SsuA/transferrin family substrate-binding protein [Chromatiales bacterium]